MINKKATLATPIIRGAILIFVRWAMMPPNGENQLIRVKFLSERMKLNRLKWK